MSSETKGKDKQCEIFSVLWLDPNKNIDDTKKTEQKLRSLINNLKKFHEVASCRKCIDESSNQDRLILIVSGQLGAELVPEIYQLRQVVSIYVFCMNVKAHSQWASKYSKVKAVLNNLDELVEQLTKNHNIQRKLDEPFAFDVFTTSKDPGQSTVGIFGQFIFFQVLIDCIIRLKPSPTDIAELIKLCKSDYEGNLTELQHIRDFEKQYSAENALSWYTKDTFFYKTLNAALRRSNIHVIFLMHEFIADIQRLLKKHQSNKPLTVYRGQCMTKNELERLNSSVGKLISINSFFSTSTNKAKAVKFLKMSDNLESILFEIQADPKIIGVKPFADIRQFSQYPDESEVLFMIGSIFRLDRIRQNEEKIWIINMTLSSDEEHDLKQVLMHMKGQSGTGQTSLRTLGKVLLNMGKFDFAEQYYQRQLKDLKPDDPLACELYEDLGDLAALRGDYDASVKWRQRALRLKNGKEMNSTNNQQANTAAGAQLRSAVPDTKSSGSTTADTEEFRKFLASFLKQHAEALKQQVAKAMRDPNSVENFCYVLENKLSITKAEKESLRGLINLGFTFDDVNSEECLRLIRRIRNERIILILSKTSMENLAKSIREEPFLNAVYVIDSGSENNFDLPVYHGSFLSMKDLLKQLERELPELAGDLTTISSIPANYTEKSTLSYIQVLKEILLDKDENRNPKKEMIDFCREKYAGNTIQLKLINEFENKYRPENAMDWYSRRETFIYKMLTRAFRIIDVDIMYRLRYFIQHLHQQIESSTNTKAMTVHRTLRIRQDLLKKLRSYENAMLSFNEFFFASRKKSTTEPSPTISETKLVHFHINLGADIPKINDATNPNEILITFGTIFHVDNIESIEEKTFTITLTTNADVLKAGQKLSKNFRDAMRGSFPLLRMTKLMKFMDLFDYLEYFCSVLMDDTQATTDKSANQFLGGVLHFLGGQCYENKQYEEGLVHLQNALNVYRRYLPSDHIQLTPTYNNIGSIYHRQGLNEKALEYHMKAYKIQKESSDPDMASVAAYAGNIASVLIKLDRHKEAVSYYEYDLKINRKLKQNQDDGEIAAKFHNLAGMQYRAEMYTEALENYDKCLEIELKCHTADNPTVTVTYYNKATALEKLGRLQEAKECVEKGIERLLRTKKEDSEEVKMNRRYLKKLDEKLFMKDLLK